MQTIIIYFQQLIHAAFALHFNEGDKCDSVQNIPLSDASVLSPIIPESINPTFEEQVILLLAIMPHISPRTMDLFFLQNKDLDRPYTEFGGWKGTSHNGFLPTGGTAAFLLSVAQPGDREKVMHLFSREHWFYKNNILHLEGQGEGEPFLSGRLIVPDEVLTKLQNRAYEPEYNASFPAKRITTPLDWSDLVLPYNLKKKSTTSFAGCNTKRKSATAGNSTVLSSPATVACSTVRREPAKR